MQFHYLCCLSQPATDAYPELLQQGRSQILLEEQIILHRQVYLIASEYFNYIKASHAAIWTIRQ